MTTKAKASMFWPILTLAVLTLAVALLVQGAIFYALANDQRTIERLHERNVELTKDVASRSVCPPTAEQARAILMPEAK
jgi:Tfp pilus assembly protein PilN